MRSNERPTAEHSLYGDAGFVSVEHPLLTVAVPTTSALFADIPKRACPDLSILGFSDSSETTASRVSPASSLSPAGSVSTTRTLSSPTTPAARQSTDAHTLDSLDHLMREFSIDQCDSTIATVERSRSAERDAAEATQTHLGLMLMREHLKGL